MEGDEMEVISKEDLKQQFIDILVKLGNGDYNIDNSCMVFVYNSIENIEEGDLHKSECVYDEEIKQIENAFYSVPHLPLYSFDSEDKFINQASALKSEYQRVYVYSMAQNLRGAGRRCLIPLLCEYYGFINISSDSRSSLLGGDKKLMYDILANNISMPPRLFLNCADNDAIKSFIQKHKETILKPNSESASIGVYKIPTDIPTNKITELVRMSLKEYHKIFLEEYIHGDEVECTILPWGNNLFIGDPIQIIKTSEFLDYKTVATADYDFGIYNNVIAEKIKQMALKAYNMLGFNSIARFDFMVRNGTTYLFDITPNPTISHCSSANKTVEFISYDDRTIYQLLLFQQLFVPPFN